jgi:hypothetical protein
MKLKEWIKMLTRRMQARSKRLLLFQGIKRTKKAKEEFQHKSIDGKVTRH